MGSELHEMENPEPQADCSRCKTKDPIELSAHQKNIIANLFPTNIPPSINERLELEKFVADGQQLAHDLVHQMQALTTALTETAKALEKTDQEVQKAKDVLHPLRDLPLDILHEIFLAAAAPENNVCWSSVDCRSTPWKLARVCQRFRQVSLSFPPMWSDLRVEWCYSGDIRARRGLEYHLCTQLQRAEARPRSVSLSSLDDQDIIPSDYLLTILSSSSSHWKHLEIHLPFHSISALHLLHANLTALQSLHVSPHYPDFKNIDPEYWKALRYVMGFLPSLKSFSGDPVAFVSTAFPAKQNLKTFRTQNVKSRRAGWYLSVLEQAKSLERCYIVDIVPGPKVNGETLPMVKADHLRVLHIYEHLEGGVEDVLNHLTAPRLQVLHINGRVTFQCLKDLAERSEMHLQELCLITPTFPIDSCLGLVSLFPNLRILELRCQEAFCVDILRALVPPDNQFIESSEAHMNWTWPSLRLFGIGRVNAADSETALEALKYPTELDDTVLISRLIEARPSLTIVSLPPIQLRGVKPTRRRIVN